MGLAVPGHRAALIDLAGLSRQRLGCPQAERDALTPHCSPPPTQTHRHTDTQTHTDTHTHKQTQTQTQTRT
eukprot:9414157-Alexandrium_andersonii.AAC.1